MKTYIFLTNSIGGYSGGPSYINNKIAYLKENGWEISVFDTGGSLKVFYPNLIPYSKNRIKELYFHPSWFTSFQRNKVCNIITQSINPQSDTVVIESNTTILAEWGEIIATRSQTKHLIFLLGEHNIINDKKQFDFLFYKYQHKEIFSISAKAFENLFSKFYVVPNSDDCHWNAMSTTQPEEIPLKEICNIKDLDFTICHLGRLKLYVPYMIEQFCCFVKQYPNKTFNIIFMGIEEVNHTLIHSLELNTNVNLIFIESQNPIPKVLFRKSDIVIATAGCARIAFCEGVKTISMDVETNRPLGIMGYTTNQISYSSEQYPDSTLSLSELLEEVLIKQTYNQPYFLKEMVRDKGYDYHMSFIDNRKEYYHNVLNIASCKTMKYQIMRIFTKLGLVSLVRKGTIYAYQKKNHLK